MASFRGQKILGEDWSPLGISFKLSDKHLNPFICEVPPPPPPPYIVFVDVTKAFDLVSRKGLFKLLEEIGCPQKLLRVVLSFCEGHSSVQGVIICCLPHQQQHEAGLCPCSTLFGIFFSLLLSYAFSKSEDGVFLHMRSDGKLFNLSCL